MSQGTAARAGSVARGGRNLGDENCALFKCPSCGRVYLIDYEVDTIYLDADNLSRRADASPDSFACVACGYMFRSEEPIIGPMADRGFEVTWADLIRSPWSWVARRCGGE